MPHVGQGLLFFVASARRRGPVGGCVCGSQPQALRPQPRGARASPILHDGWMDPLGGGGLDVASLRCVRMRARRYTVYMMYVCVGTYIYRHTHALERTGQRCNNTY
jgi:hypothetical protein